MAEIDQRVISTCCPYLGMSTSSVDVVISVSATFIYMKAINIC